MGQNADGSYIDENGTYFPAGSPNADPAQRAKNLNPDGSYKGAPTNGGSSLGNWLGGAWNSLSHATDESPSAKAQRDALNQQAAAGGAFADQGQTQFGTMGVQGQQNIDALRQTANGQNSVSAEQLRQGLQQNLAGQRSMAASASPGNSAMAARTAATQMGRMGSGLAGQQAVAGLQERNQAQQNLTGAIQGLRGQDLQAALGGRQAAIAGYGGVKPEGSEVEKWAGPIMGAASIYAKSDRRLKTDIKDGDDEARKITDALKSYMFSYKNEKHGKGARVGVMAQDLEKAGLGHAVIDQPDGKAIHSGHLAASNTAMIAALGRRLSKVESGK